MVASRTFVAFDLETTGLSPRSDEVIEVGAVRFDEHLEVIDRLELLVDPGRPLPLAVQRLTGLRPDDLVGAPSPAEAIARFARFAEGADLVAHGASFDLAFCAAHAPDAFARRRVFDTLELARILLPTVPAHGLGQLSALFGLEHRRPHRAGSDADATRLLFGLLRSVAAALPGPVLDAMRRLVAGLDLALADFLLTLVPDGRPQPPPWTSPEVLSRRRSSSPDFRGATREASLDPPSAGAGHRATTATVGASPAGEHRPPTVVGEGGGAEGRAGRAATEGGGVSPPGVAISRRRGWLTEEVAQVLGPSGPFAADPAYELREAQVDMARAVSQTLERRRRLLVEAPTGLGKSLAYLVPLALWCRATGKRAVVATHTVPLQEQLAERDLPLVVERLGLPLRIANLKGRQHFLSLRRWERFLRRAPHSARGAGLDVLRFKLKILCWLAQTSTGDRAELRLGQREETLWRQVQSDADDCLGVACANWRTGACYMVAGRRAAEDADIVVTNHALLLADMERQGRALPPYDVLVVDEAHRLEEAATRLLGDELRASDVTTALDRLGEVCDAELHAALAAAREATVRLFGEVKGTIQQIQGTDTAANAMVAVPGQATEGVPRAAGLVRMARRACEALARAQRALEGRRGAEAVVADLLPQPELADEEMAAVAAVLEAARRTIERVLLAPRPDHVAWLALQAEQTELHEAPISVAGTLASRLFDPRDAVILTSATLAVGGRMDFVRARTGIGAQADELVVPSPFDYLSQALCVLAKDMPGYDDEGYEEALAEVVVDVARRLGGRTLVLFTSYAALRSTHSLISGRLARDGIAVLGQGLDGTRRQVLAGFLENRRTVLLGTTTFWEGVDIPGEALAAVVVAKLPFPVPTDPLLQARSATVRDPFVDLVLPMAVLRLRQGFGRLIRRGDDRGAVVLCDSRLATREYGPAFLDALPETRLVVTGRAPIGQLVADFVSGMGPAPRDATLVGSRLVDGNAERPEDAEER